MFERKIRNMGAHFSSHRYEPGTVYTKQFYALKIRTAAGITGEYVSRYAVDAGSMPLIAGHLLGQNALERERIYNDLKRFLKLYARIGLGAVDIALWDLAGKYYGAPIFELLGGYRRRLPVYASTARGDEHGGLDSPEAYADFAEQCLALGYRAFKIHPWMFGTAPLSKHVELIHAVGRRVGGRMDLMLDPALEYSTFGEAVKVGRACDEERFFWLEDPLQDGGTAHYAHRRLRALIRTPLLQGEYVRGLEERMNLLIADATDFVRGDVPGDGITATMKLAHAAESLGIDVEMHLGGPETRQCVAAIRNCNYYEWGMLHPRTKWDPDPVYRDEYVEGRLDGIDADGCISVPSGPGLGVEYDWDYISSHCTGAQTYGS